MSKLLCSVLKISGGGNAPNDPPRLRACLEDSFCGTISYMLRTKSALSLVCHLWMW